MVFDAVVYGGGGGAPSWTQAPLLSHPTPSFIPYLGQNVAKSIDEPPPPSPLGDFGVCQWCTIILNLFKILYR